MADDQWLLKEDGYLNVNTEATNVIYHSNLNVILVFTKNNEVKVLDIKSGVVLQSVSVSVADNKVYGRYLPKQDKVLFWDTKNIGLRGDYNGVLLLDTILQTPIARGDDMVKVELLLSEAALFLQSIHRLEEHGLESTADVVNEFTARIDEAHSSEKKGIKALKWNTICLELPYSCLKIVATNVLLQLKRYERHIPALAIASAINERLSDLLIDSRKVDAINSGNSQRLLMYSEAIRRQTFARWPHMNYRWALPNQLAQAGFYYHPGTKGDDRAMCFTCNVCLVCWEETDEPWSEHERNSPNCPFVKGEYTQNVPLAVTYATYPALETDGFTIMSQGTQTDYICTGTETGHIDLWKIKRQTKMLGSVEIIGDVKSICSNQQTFNVKLSSICTWNSIDQPTISKTKDTLKSLNIICGISIKNKLFLIKYNIVKLPLPKCDTVENPEVDPIIPVVELVSEVKKPSLKNLLDDPFEEEMVLMGTIPQNIPASVAFKAMNHVPIITDDMELHLMNGSILDFQQSNGKSSDNNKNNDNNNEIVAASTIADLTLTEEIEPISFKITQSFQIISILPGSYEISEVIPAYDSNYLLVILRKCSGDTSPVVPMENVKMEVDDDDDEDGDDRMNEKDSFGVQLFVYRLESNGNIINEPICSRALFVDHAPVEICMLPSLSDTSLDVTDAEHNEVFAMICSDGSLQLLALVTLQTLSTIEIDGKFISVTYCKNLERLCACTSNGRLHFYSLYDIEIDSGDEQEDEKMNLVVSDASNNGEIEITETDGNVLITASNYLPHVLAIPSTSNSPLQGSSGGSGGGNTSNIGTSASNTNIADIFAYKNELKLHDLKTLYQLTLFDEILTPFTAEVPACWNEFIEAQKQKRHTQHLRPGDDTHLIKTFRLHNDATTWDEHIIEITLPKLATLGHVNFKFSLYQQCPNPPAIQITLLKQNTSGFGYRMKAPGGKISTNLDSIPVDENIDFKIDFIDTKDNPVLTEEYLQSHNADIIAGPIELASCMDLSEQGGSVTLTSPKLFRTKSRNFLLHIKTMVDVIKDGPGKTKGCDWLHEISLSVRSTKNVYKIQNERLQRIAMLESNTLLGNLLTIASKTEMNIEKNIALDILLWIISIRLTRYRSPKTDYPKPTKITTNSLDIVIDMCLQQIDCINIVQAKLTDLMRNCIIYGNRSTAKKCVKIIIISLEGANNMLQEKIERRNFEIGLKNAILACMPELTVSKYAGALRWFTLLISGTSTSNSQAQISEKCVELLLSITEEIGKRWSPFTSLLRTRFGLYGLPFEPNLFDAELALSSKYNALPNALISTSKTIGQTQTSTQQNNVIDLKKFCSNDGMEFRCFPTQIRRKGISNQMRGLLEVEPLHFTCCAASEATRIENINANTITHTEIVLEDVIETPTPKSVEQPTTENHFPISNMSSVVLNSVQSKDSIELEGDEDYLNNFKNILVDKIYYSAIQKQKLKHSSQTHSNHIEKSNYLNNVKSNAKSGNILNDVDYKSISKIIDMLQENMDSFENVFMQSLSTKIQEFMTNNCFDDNNSSIPWHKLLSLPPKQMIVVDRMQSGAIRFITLDFGSPIMLTDLVIPACEDLVSIYIDIWCFEEKADSIRLAESKDIATNTLVLSDLQPPPICRYLKITTTGRHGMSATRSKIPIGSFFGHVLVLENDGYADPVLKYIKPKSSSIPTQLKALNSLYEDVHCRYSLSSSKLSELLEPLFSSDISNVAHMQAYLNKNKENETPSVDQTRILNVYEECITFQHQLIAIQNVIQRLEAARSIPRPIVYQQNLNTLHTVSLDKLRVLSECLVEVLLHFIIEYGVKNVAPLHGLFNLNTCTTLFNNLVVCGENNMQLATCSLLVRMCCFQPWWGEFLSSTFIRLYSSQNTEVFPQDRVFFLLTYLGRKSISMGTCRTSVIDAILKTLATLLVPLSTNTTMDHDYHNDDITGAKTDFQLISWLLLFLSVCLDDGVDKKEQSSVRWDFMTGEADVSKARAQTTTTSSGRSFSRSFKKRFQQKQSANSSSAATFNDKIYTNDKAIHMAQLTSQLEQALKQQADMLQKNIYHPLPEIIMEITGNNKNITRTTSVANKLNNLPKVAKETSFAESVEQTNIDKGLKSLKSSNILIVIRGLIGLILAMDYTCNMDLFLLTCKIIARLVSICRPSIQLSKIITTNQLQQLIRLAVWKDQQQPWAVHAITCLLQGILEADKNFNLESSFDEGQNEMDGIIETAEVCANNTTSTMSTAAITNTFDGEPLIPKTTLGSNLITKDMSYADALKSNHLPSLMECEDAEMDDLLNEIVERKNLAMKKDNSLSAITRTDLTSVYRSVSAAMDARLDYGLETNVEIKISRLTMMSSLNLFSSLSQIPLSEMVNCTIDIPAWPEYVIQAWSGPEYLQGTPTHIMFVQVFDIIFSDLYLQDSWLNLEQVLQLWLTLNSELSDKGLTTATCAVEAPKIPFGTSAVEGLLSALAWHPGIKLRTWSLAFQCLTLSCYPSFIIDNSSEQEENKEWEKIRMGVVIVDNQHFEEMLLRFYSSADMNSSENRCAGPTICKQIAELLVWMDIKSHVFNVRYVKKKLKEILLRVVRKLVQPGGAISLQQGPIDAQNLLIKECIQFPYEKADLGIAMSIIESVSYLVHNHISNVEKVYCQRTSDASSNVFGGIFDTVLGSDNSRQNKVVSDNSLLVCLLKLSCKLVQTTLPRKPDESNNSNDMSFAQIESQTDEIKAEQQQQPNHALVKVPCVADTVLQHYPTMTRFLSSLSQSSSSSFDLLASSLYPLNNTESNNPIIDPTTVADAVFQILMLLSKKATQPNLVIKPLYDFLNSTSSIGYALPKLQLSKPFLWFVLKVFETPTTVKVFTEMGGIKVLCQSLVRCNRTLINMQPGLVSLIMQYISKSPKHRAGMISNAANVKKSSISSKSSEGLINFAPFCTISMENNTAQPPDVLIQTPITAHRRARTPIWSYLFYPNESHIDLTITLPTAILLKEVQLQPHLPSLVSTPSAVAMEINRDSSIAPVPISQPMSTDGLTNIRLKLPQPEIVNSIVLRLYKPKDSTSINLNQISVFGTTVFSGVKNIGQDSLMGDDDAAAKSSLGWLKILARCFSVATFNVEDQDLPNMVIQSAADYPGFLEACCSLLNVTAAGSNAALQNVETVLLKLGLHSKELGLKLIENLLKSTLPQTFRQSNEAVSDLLYDLCTSKDDFTNIRIAALINWTKNLYEKYHSQKNSLRTNPCGGFVKCLSSILWTVHTSQISNDLHLLITEDLFYSVYMWIDQLEQKEPLKSAMDSMLCSICCIRPELFPLLLKQMGVLVPNLSTGIDASICDDRKDTEGMTDDIKQEANNTGEWYSRLVLQDMSKLSLTSKQLKTIAIACQSELAVHQLLDSGLPKLLSMAVLEFCNQSRITAIRGFDNWKIQHQNTTNSTDADKAENISAQRTTHCVPLANAETIAEILDFFSETCSEGHMRDWLGSYEGSNFWSPLLDLLCNEKILDTTTDTSMAAYSKLEAETIKFLSKVTSCHPKNQDNLTTILISVIKKPNNHHPTSAKNIISGFTRRLILQLLLESERILVSVRSKLPLQKRESIFTPINNHPSKRPNANHILFYLSTQIKCQEILDNCVYNNLVSTASVLGELSAKQAAIAESTNALLESRKELLEFGVNLGSGMEFLSMAAGVTAKDKRLKEAKNQVAALKTKDLFPLFKFKSVENFPTSSISNTLVHPFCPTVVLGNDTSISQILAMLHNAGISLATPCITLNLIQSQNKIDELTDDTQTKAADLEPLHSPLQVFSSRGGLSLLAHYLPNVYPENPKTMMSYAEKEKSPPVSEWVKVEHNEDIYEDLEDPMAESSSKHSLNLTVPQHSLAAFGLFLRLPAYSDVLLRDKVKAQCLLRLVLGVTGDGEGNEIYSLSLASSLPTLPFEVFRQLLDCSPLTTDDGVLLRRMVIDVGAMHLVLNCLGIFTHHSQVYQPNVGGGVGGGGSTSSNVVSGSGSGTSNADNQNGTAARTPGTQNADEPLVSDDMSHIYWAKGTGFGTGSMEQSWDIEQALLRQKSEEEHVTVLLQILSSYVNPGDQLSSMVADITDITAYTESIDSSPELPSQFLDLLHNSCLIPALSSYLRNDSVLDITRHIPLYRSILQLLRAIAGCNQLVSLLMLQKRDDGIISIASLLTNMKICVDTYASRLKVNKKSNIKGQTQKVILTLDDGDDEGLALLIPDIQETTILVQKATKLDTTYVQADDEQHKSISRPLSKSIEQRYLEIMKKLQFDTYEMIVESENGYRFAISHHFENNVRMAGDRSFTPRMKRLAQETVTLSTSLPLSYSSSVFVRCDNDRLDIMKVLITGPSDTPYANGCFEFDVYFPPDYPNSPMMINLETTGRHTVRFNPNLYNDGKVCLSVLNTWHGRPEEKWNAQTSSFLQVLVSIQSLILVTEPYFNEPGFERSRGSPSGTQSSKEYNSNIYQACVRWAMLEQIKNPCPCFKQIVHTHFWLKRQEICNQIEEWIVELNKTHQNERTGRAINSLALRRQYRQLREELAKLPVPEGFEDLDKPFTANINSPTIVADSTVSTIATTATTTLQCEHHQLQQQQQQNQQLQEDDSLMSLSVYDGASTTDTTSTTTATLANIQMDSNDSLVTSIYETI